MNKSLNLDQSCIMLDEILYGQPILYANGMGEGSLDRKPGSIIKLPLAESKITAVAIPSDIPHPLPLAAHLPSSNVETNKVSHRATRRHAPQSPRQLPRICRRLRC